eukprot:7377542-Prymnesium_polylepis.3
MHVGARLQQLLGHADASVQGCEHERRASLIVSFVRIPVGVQQQIDILLVTLLYIVAERHLRPSRRLECLMHQCELFKPFRELVFLRRELTVYNASLCQRPLLARVSRRG